MSIFFGEVSAQIFPLFFNWIIWFLESSFHNLEIRHSLMICKYLLPVYSLSLHFLNTVFHKAKVFIMMKSNLSMFQAWASFYPEAELKDFIFECHFVEKMQPWKGRTGFLVPKRELVITKSLFGDSPWEYLPAHVSGW